MHAFTPYFVVGLVAILLVLGYTLGTFVYAYVATHPPRLRIRRLPSDEGLAYEAVTFPARDGLRISGWLIPASPHNTLSAVVVVCHGYPMNRMEMLPHAQLLHKAGYATLLFDFRAMGESHGHFSSAGHHEIEDLLGAVDFLATRPDTAHCPVGVLGHSLGAAVGIMAAARDTRIKAVVAESSYPTLHDALAARFRTLLGPFTGVITHPVRYWARLWMDFEPELVSPLKDISLISPRAVFIIQGKRDLLVRWKDAVEMYEAAKDPREIWLLERSAHTRCLHDSPDEYARRVCSFFRRHLVCAPSVPPSPGAPD